MATQPVQFKLLVDPAVASMEDSMNEAASDGWSLEFFQIASSGHAVALFSKPIDGKQTDKKL